MQIENRCRRCALRVSEGDSAGALSGARCMHLPKSAGWRARTRRAFSAPLPRVIPPVLAVGVFAL